MVSASGLLVGVLGLKGCKIVPDATAAQAIRVIDRNQTQWTTNQMLGQAQTRVGSSALISQTMQWAVK